MILSVADNSLNIKVTIEVQGPEGEVRQWMARFGAADGRGSATTWTPELADRLVTRISDRAREALRYMARGAPTIDFHDLQSELDVDGLGLGGILASFGFAERKGLPRPYRVDRERREYHMDPSTADAMLEAIDRYEGADE
jgi:hypothetical protein